MNILHRLLKINMHALGTDNKIKYLQNIFLLSALCQNHHNLLHCLYAHKAE